MPDMHSVPPPPKDKPLLLAASGKSAAPAVPVTITPEMVSAVSLPEMVRELDQQIHEAKGRAERPDLYDHRHEVKSLTALVAIRGVLAGFDPVETAQDYAPANAGTGA